MRQHLSAFAWLISLCIASSVTHAFTRKCLPIGGWATFLLHMYATFPLTTYLSMNIWFIFKTSGSICWLSWQKKWHTYPFLTSNEDHDLYWYSNAYINKNVWSEFMKQSLCVIAVFTNKNPKTQRKRCAFILEFNEVYGRWNLKRSLCWYSSRFSPTGLVSRLRCLELSLIWDRVESSFMPRSHTQPCKGESVIAYVIFLFPEWQHLAH